MYIQKYKYLFLYLQSEIMYRTCFYHVYTWIYQPKQVHTCYKQPKALYLHVLHAIKKIIITGIEQSAYQRAALTITPPFMLACNIYSTCMHFTRTLVSHFWC